MFRYETRHRTYYIYKSLNDIVIGDQSVYGEAADLTMGLLSKFDYKKGDGKLELYGSPIDRFNNQYECRAI